MKKRLFSVVTLSIALSVTAAAQYPKFEVASIKPCQDSDRSGGGGAPSPGSLHLNCVTVASLIRLAYLAFPTGQTNMPVSPSVFQQPISGGPAWIDSDRYRIDARAGEAETVEMQRGLMLQGLPEDRFRLKLHREYKETTVFEVTAAKGKPKLSPARDAGCATIDRNHPGEQPERMSCGMLHVSTDAGTEIRRVTIADLCRQLNAYVNLDIVDRTGIAGAFDIHLDLNAAELAPDPSEPDARGAVISALEKLGLGMRPAKERMPFLVVDRMERPSEN